MYRKVDPRFWKGRTASWIRDNDSKLFTMALYLITCPHANMIGIYYLPAAYISHDLGRGFGGASEGLRSLEEGVEKGAGSPFIRYDHDTCYVWVVNMLRYQVGTSIKTNDNRSKSIKTMVSEVPKGLCFLRGFYDKYADGFHLGELKELKPLRSPFVAPPKPLRSQEQEQEQEQEQKKDICTIPRDGTGGKANQSIIPKARRRIDYPEDFEEFWRIYPSRGSASNPKFKAFSKWNCALRLEVDDEGNLVKSKQIMDAVARYRLHVESEEIEGTSRTMMAQTFLGPRCAESTGNIHPDSWQANRDVKFSGSGGAQKSDYEIGMENLKSRQKTEVDFGHATIVDS